MRPGDVLGRRFELEQLAGSGGMGEVFRARDRASGETVAVKVLLAGHGPDRGRFTREAEVLAQLSHPGIVRYVAHGETPSGEPYLAMEWLSGEDLASRLLRGPLSVEETVALGMQVAVALAMAHAHGVVHRDLKPSNLFLQERDVRQIRLLDFGIARRFEATPITETGVVVGTPGYMAPEQALSGQEIDARADVFALGCVLFECVTGAPLFAGEHFMAVLAKILYQAAPRMREQQAGVPPALDALVARMLAKEPAERPRDAVAVAEALAALLTSSTWPAEAAASSRSVPPLSLTGSERRMLSLVLLGRAQAPLAEPPLTLNAAEVTSAAETLREAAKAHGGRLELLADGSAIVTFQGSLWVATDQVAQAARAALSLRPLAGDRPMVLAMGWVEITGKLLVGDVIDRAAQMLARRAAGAERARAAGGARPIAIDEVTAGLLDARFEVVKETTGFELHGEREIAEGARLLLGKPTACVGRDRELATLEAVLTECVEELKARTVLVTAPAGMGKSRLAYELMGRARRRGDGTAIWVGRVDSLRAGSTLGLLGQALRSGLGIQEGEPLEARRDKIGARVSEHVLADNQRRVAEFVGELVGTPFPDEESVPLRAARQDAQIMSDQMRWAWMDFLRAESAAHPVLLVLEDLHWGDLSTVRFIGAALREVSDKPWMVLALARPEVHALFPRLWGQRQAEEIRLKKLTPKASEQLVGQVLGESVGPRTVERIVVQAEGHPFYLEELIRAVAEGKGAALPDTVLAMVEARLAGLEGEVRQVLRAASVFGEVFWRGGLRALLGSSFQFTMLEDWLRALVEQEVVVRRSESQFPGEVEFTFRHALLREGAYAMLTEEDRGLGHRLAGAWLDQHGEANPLVLAEHFERGGEGARAGGFYLRAAEQALRAGDSALAIARAHLGLACGVPDTVRMALLGTLCEAHAWTFQTMRAALPFAEELLRRAQRGSVPWCQGALTQLTGTVFEGRREAFLATLRVVLETEPSPDAAGNLALALGFAAYLLDILGRVQEGDALTERLFVLARAVGDRQPLLSASWNGIMALRQFYGKEDPFGGLAHANAALETNEIIGDGRSRISMQVVRGMHLWLLGAPLPALQALQGDRAANEELGLVSTLRRFSLAWLLADRGALDEARLCATTLIEVAQFPLDEGRGRWVLAEALRRAGELERADRELQAALAILGAAAPLEHPGALATLSALRLAQGRADEALAAAEEALARYESAGACGFSRGAFVRLTHVEALHAAGHPERARAAVVVARDRLLASAAKIGDPAYRKSFLEGVSENARTFALAGAWLGEGEGEGEASA